MPPVRPLAAALIVVLAIVAVACAEEGPPTVSPSATVALTETPTSDPSATTPEPSETPTTSASVAAELEDGRHFGFIRSVDIEAQTMRFDLAYFLTGDEADAAAADHGDEVPVPNDYYIVNDNPRLRTLDVDPDVEIWVIDWKHCCDLVRGEIQPFVDAFATRRHPWNALYQGRQAPYWVTVEDGAVVKIEVQFLP